MPPHSHRNACRRNENGKRREYSDDGLFWEKPIDFDGITVPQLDTTTLPEKLKAFVDAVTDSLQVPCELVLVNALAATAIAVQKKAQVLVNAGYSEPLNIYMMAALPPGERKSAVVEICKAPLVDWEDEQKRLMADDRRQAITSRKCLEKRLEKATARLGSGKQGDDRKVIETEIRALEDELFYLQVPGVPRLLADDVTAEGFVFLLSQQEERLGIMEAEGDLFNILAGRYSKTPNFTIYLKAWNGEQVIVDRRRSESITLKSPLLTLCLSPQPDVIKSLADIPSFRGRGLLGRFLYLLPDSRVGSRVPDAAPVSESVKAKYKQKIEGMLNIKPQRNSEQEIIPYTISLSPDADKRRKEFFSGIETAMGRAGNWTSSKTGEISCRGMLFGWRGFCTVGQVKIRFKIKSAVTQWKRLWILPRCVLNMPRQLSS